MTRAQPPPSTAFDTHVVENQPPPMSPSDLWAGDVALRDAVEREGGGWATPELAAYGPVAGGEVMALGFTANENKPRLHAFDRSGHRVDEVEFHPAWHRIMELAIEHEVPTFAWRRPERPGAHVARSALCYLHYQGEAGTSCPLTMNYACVPALAHAPEIAKAWLPKVLSTRYDPGLRPLAEKSGVLLGMGMTEKQGGSDVRTNSTRAVPVATRGLGEEYRLVGHKWFFSAPMCDAFLVLAQADGGLSCFFMPRLRPDGTRNAIRLQRLKDKLGNWSNASSEVEFTGASAWLVGEEGRGVATILEMVALTRLDCMTGSAALIRQALAQAVHHARHRRAFGALLVDKPLMQQVLADLALESEAAIGLSLRVARAVDRSRSDPVEAAFARVATAIGKYWVCKRTVVAVNEAQECLGGAGYVEESMLARLYREAPLNSIWEGSGNVQSLDVLRALARDAGTREALRAELAAAHGAHPLLDEHCATLGPALEQGQVDEAQARWLAEQLALALQAAVLYRSPQQRWVADAFCEARLARHRGLAFGALPGSLPAKRLIERALA